MQSSLELLGEIRPRLEAIEASLPTRIDPIALSRSKLPFKALAYRETLIWRVAELGRTAFENFEAERLAAAILLTRAVVETTAALWYLWTKITKTTNAGAIGDIDDYLMKLAMGNRMWEEAPDAINVMTFIDCAEKTFEGFKEQYGMLSEYAHPNYCGTAGLYSEEDRENILIDFGQKVRNRQASAQVGLVNLNVSLVIFPDAYNEIGDLMPKFIAVCEANLSK